MNNNWDKSESINEIVVKSYENKLNQRKKLGIKSVLIKRFVILMKKIINKLF
jgi:hypothetical protein